MPSPGLASLVLTATLAAAPLSVREAHAVEAMQHVQAALRVRTRELGDCRAERRSEAVGAGPGPDLLDALSSSRWPWVVAGALVGGAAVWLARRE